LIPDSFVQELLSRVDVVDVVGQHVQLRKGGANLLGLCPFHQEKSPSFTVSPTKQFYHCFGCGAHGSAITFLMEHTGASFPEAVRNLAATVGMQVPQTQTSPAVRARAAERRQEQSAHASVLDRAQTFYKAQLRDHRPAVDYLKARGLTGKLLRSMGSVGRQRAVRGLPVCLPVTKTHCSWSRDLSLRPMMAAATTGSVAG